MFSLSITHANSQRWFYVHCGTTKVRFMAQTRIGLAYYFEHHPSCSPLNSWKCTVPCLTDSLQLLWLVCDLPNLCIWQPRQFDRHKTLTLTSTRNAVQPLRNSLILLRQSESFLGSWQICDDRKANRVTNPDPYFFLQLRIFSLVDM